MAPISFKRHLSYALKCDRKVRILQSVVERLEKEKEILQRSAIDATSNGEEIYVNVIRWLSDSDKAIEEAKEVLQQREETNKCFAGMCPNLKTRYQFAKIVEKKALMIHKLHYEEGLDTISSISDFRPAVEPSMDGSELLPSRMLVLNQLMDALKDPSLNMIGVYGVGGVGKTTLAKEVFARARKEELFDYAIMISVSRFPSLRRIQAEIASFLGLKFDADEVCRRATQLHQRLKNAKLLIILDDVWQKLDLHAVGIPSGDECQGCRLLVSSRSKDVVCSEMGSQKDFLVDVLNGEESWSLFQTIAASKLEDPTANSIAIEITKKCAGLPLLIVMISIQLKNNKLYAWDEMLKKLSVFRNEDLGERVHKVVELTFSYLPGEYLKLLFLLCASFPQSNIHIQHLLIYGMGLHFFRNITTVAERLERQETDGFLLLSSMVTMIKEERHRLFVLINRLKKEGLLLDGDLDGHVKLHDEVRDAAISIAPRYQNSFIGASETCLRDWPDKDWTRVWLCNIQDLPASPHCPKAELFVLSCEDLCPEIHDLFFEGIPKLKVVGFTGMRFATGLPRSLGCLRNLDTLCFNRCRLDYISVIGELTELKFLSFADSDIVELPGEIGALTQLKLLDLTNCPKLQAIPTNVISKLSSLEELYMCNSYVRWDEEGNLSLAELEKLSCLSSLEIQIVNPKSILRFSSFYDRLSHYKIIIGKQQRWPENYERSRMLKLIKLQESFCLEDVFLSGTEDLYVEDKVSGMDDLIGEGFPRLRHLYIKNDYGIKHLIKSTAGSSFNAFPELESLRLDNLNSLEMICDGPLNMGSFRKLRILKISNCGKLKSLFSCSNFKNLWQLREMEVESCEDLEAIVSEDIEYTCLRSLKLKNLPNLKGFCYKQGSAEETGLLFHDKITLFGLMSLEVKNCKSLKYVFTTSMVKCLKSLMRLGRLEIYNCELLEEILWHKESEEVKEEEEECIDKIELRSLKCVVLKKLKNLKRFGSGFPIEFTSLTELSIHNCPAMEYFAPEISEKNSYNLDGKRFPRMSHLYIQNGCDSQHTINLNNLNSLESFYFDGRSLSASYCDKLKNFFSFSSAKCSTQLIEIHVQCCHKMEAIVGGTSEDEILELTQLRSLKLENLPHLIGFCKQKEGPGRTELLFNKMVSFPNLTSLVVEKCNSLKYVFTTSMVNCLAQLKKLEICNCEFVEAIIQRVDIEENEEDISSTIVFHKLDSLSLYGLPNVKAFGCGCEIEFLLLRELSIECPVMKNFVSKYSDRNTNCDGDEYLFNEMVTFSNLESMIVRNMDAFRYLWHGKFILDDLYLKLKSLNIINCSRISVVFLANEFRTTPKLETQGITCFEDSSLLQVQMLQEMDMYSNEEVVEFPHLCSLRLKNLPHLTGFFNEREQGFGVQVSFPNLKGLELCECENFKYVFTTSMVNSFMQLEKLEISHCELVEEILLSRKFDEIDDLEIIEKIVFPKLEYLLLNKLPNLKRFNFGYPVEFQSLKELSIFHCPVLKNFVSKYLSNECDEYLFNEMVTFPNLERMKVSHNNSFKYLWNEQFTVDDSFLKLKSLSIQYCSKLSAVFPSNIHRRFQGLESLYLCCCSRVEEIYQYEGNNFEELNFVEPFYLQDLEIRNLPSLKYIWSKDPPRASTFEYLQCVKVVSCKDLMFVFPKSIARRLLQLEHLNVSDSHMEVVIANTNVEESNFIVPQLTVLQLENLYQMSNLFKGPYTFKCPKLTQFDIYGCNQATNFHSEFKSSQFCGFDQLMLGSKVSAYQEGKLLSFVRKQFICNLEELTLDDQGLNLISSVKMRGELSKLKNITLRSLHEDSIPLLFGFLRRCSLEKLVFVDSYLEKIFLLDEEKAFQSHLRLKHLEVLGDDNLKHVLKNDSRFNPILEKLHTLNVEFCESLFNIAPSSASFQNLTSLNISCCFKMTNLVTTSAAKTMTNLMELKVLECPMMEEILGNDERDPIDIFFHKLKCLELYDLSTLNSFSSSNSAFYFPLLERVVVNKCFAMKNFCGGSVVTPKLKAVHFQDGQHWELNIDLTIASQFKPRLTSTSSWAT